MTDRYVRSTDGNNADSGATWALAKATVGGADAIESAGDRIFLSQSHNESPAGTITYTFSGTRTNPNKILCGNDAAEPPTALATTAVMNSPSGNIVIGGHVYVYGVKFNVRSGSATQAFLLMGNANHERQVYEQCTFSLEGNTNTTSIIGSNATTTLIMKDCWLKFNNNGQVFQPGDVYWNGGGLATGSATPTALFTCAAGGAGIHNVRFENLDLTVATGALNIFNARSDGAMGFCVIRNSRLPTFTTGGLVVNVSTAETGQRFAMYNCDSGATNYKFWVEDRYGKFIDETTYVKSGGATNGVTAYAWKVTTTANVVYPVAMFYTDEIVTWNTTTGSAITVTVDIYHNSATPLKDDEVWLEVSYLGNSSYPLGTFVSDCKTDILATGADQATSTASWTSFGSPADPRAQKLSVTFTPQMKGLICARVVAAIASKTFYVDPVLQIS